VAPAGPYQNRIDLREPARTCANRPAPPRVGRSDSDSDSDLNSPPGGTGVTVSRDSELRVGLEIEIGYFTETVTL